MVQTFRALVLILAFSVITGCAGKNFVPPSTDIFRLGQTSYSQVVQQMGEPRRTGDLLKNEKNVKSATYVYAAAMGEPLEEEVVPARALTYYFHNDVLVGQVFLSSFKSDNSNFDETKISEIAKGKTSRSEVIQTLGRPTGSFIAPMVKQTSGEAIGYTYQTTRQAFGGFKFFNKALRITFDDKDKVLDIEYESGDSK